ncbi:MAG: PHP domain-containing protein, partial [Anaerolineae bacterium]
MKATTKLNGLTYRKLDLHVHTPASDCFFGECSPEQLVQAAIDKGLDGIAITDHNTPNWIDRVIDAAKGKPLTVFPGVEVTCQSGEKAIHVVALFDVVHRSEQVRILLTKLDIYEPIYGKQEALAQKTPQEVIKVVSDLGGVPVLAHANSSNGVLHDMSGQARNAVIRCPSLAAVEATDFGDDVKKQKRKRVIDLLDGTDPNYQRKMAVYQASDNPCDDGSGRHCLGGIGTRCAYFKMETVNLDGLRQCFADPDVRIKQDFELKTFTYPHIKGIKVTSGFLDEQEAAFHTGLNSILGAKGAGKSLLIEFLRFGLNQEPGHRDIRPDHDSKLRTRLGEYGIIEVAFVDETGNEFQVKRTYCELDKSLYDSDEVPYDPAQIFPVLFLSQNEIIRIAEDEAEQLAFIDRFFDFRAYKSQIESYERDLARLDERMAAGLRAYKEYEELTKQVETTRAEIARLDAALSHPIFEQYRQLELKERSLSEQDSYFVTLTNNLEMARSQLVQRGIPDIPEPLRSDPALRRNRDVIESANKVMEDQFALLG